ncbi:type 4a pilus biogenesis protein PilO [Gilvimarinus sp. SDUM040013]|uniref:Type 4a pilus biogenesis protein PilO n=1 Tax=Gilvimarinus gilvus TaxID=3058038 RepID=A0ABU4RY76_9GAMM|nr:type 4a pilus biogenesis protein PilO [Gilvimarinus sp. SDUM040013]MDO3387388.1 type 4a pilus biogenesis protein PilO [Gilvimarinus sp. SDUM040013]MDX6849865.1 type 4a pilus biogenesis protein PilO [Gilvimarinus sp. SDUM040013]
MSWKDSIERAREFDYSDSEKLGVWPLPTKILICLFIAGALVFAAYWFKVKTIEQQLSGEQAKERTLWSSFESKAAQAANLDAYKEQMQEMKASFESLLSRLPTDTEVAGLLDDIDARSVESGLGDFKLDLQAEQDAEYYVEKPIQVSVRGGYHDFGGFVSGIAGMPRIVTLHDFSIEQSDGGGDLTMQITAKTYYYQGGEQGDAQ